LLMNATPEDREFTLPHPPLPWRILIDSAEPDAPERGVTADTIIVENRAAMILVAVS
jgi:isoamylase